MLPLPLTPMPKVKATFHATSPRSLPSEHATMDESTMFLRLSRAETVHRNDQIIVANYSHDVHGKWVEEYVEVTNKLWAVVRL